MLKLKNWFKGLKKRNKVIMIVVVICLSIGLIGTLNENSNKVYQLNPIGFYSTQDVKEKYNEKGDLIYLKYKDYDENNKITKYDYKYDSENRVIEIIMNQKPLLGITYNDQGLVFIITDYVLGYQKVHKYNKNNEIESIDEYWKDPKTELLQSSGNIVYRYYTTDDIEYVKEIESNSSKLITRIYLKKDISESKNIFKLINYAPQMFQLVGNMVDSSGFVSETWDVKAIPNFNKYLEQTTLNRDSGKSSVSENYIDKNNKILKAKIGFGEYYYKYENINDNEIVQSSLSKTLEIDTTNKSLGVKMITKYFKGTKKCYYKDGKIDSYTQPREIEITEQEYNKMLTEYKQYFVENNVEYNLEDNNNVWNLTPDSKNEISENNIDENRNEKIGNLTVEVYMPKITINNIELKSKIQDISDIIQENIEELKGTSLNLKISVNHEMFENNNIISLLIKKVIGYENSSGEIVFYNVNYNKDNGAIVDLENYLNSKNYKLSEFDLIYKSRIEKINEEENKYLIYKKLNKDKEFYIKENILYIKTEMKNEMDNTLVGDYVEFELK